MNRLSRPVLALVLALLGTACGDGLTLPKEGEGPVTALIDGLPFVSTLATASRNNGRINVDAVDAFERRIAFTFPDDGPGTFTIGPGQLVSAAFTAGTDQDWIAGASTGSGSIEVTAVTDSRIVGTFSFSVVATGGETPNRLTITEGALNIEY